MTTLQAFKIGPVNYLMIILKIDEDICKIKYEIMGSLGTHVCCSINKISGQDELNITQSISDMNETLVFKYSIDDNSDFMFIKYSDLLNKKVEEKDKDYSDYYCVKKNIHIDIDYTEHVEDTSIRTTGNKLYTPVSDEEEDGYDSNDCDINNEIGIAALFDMRDSDSLEEDIDDMTELDLCEHCGDLCEGEDAVDEEGNPSCATMIEAIRNELCPPEYDEMLKENGSDIVKPEPLKLFSNGKI